MAGMNMGGRSFVPPPPVTEELWGAQGQTANSSDLYTIDPITAAATPVGPTGFAITGMAFRPSDGQFFGVTSNNSTNDPRSLITINTLTGAGTLIGALGVTNGIADISFRSDDTLFGWGSTTHRLYTINTSSGAATQVSATTFGTFGGALTFDSTDVLNSFSNGSDGEWYTVDPSTGTATGQGTLSGFGSTDAISAATVDQFDVVWATVVESSTVTSLATIDRTTDTVTQVATTLTLLDALAWSF